MKRFIFLSSFLFCISISNGQEYGISGRVIDAGSRVALPFVNIVMNDGMHGGTTDIDGKFEFRSSEKIQNLTFSFVGYETQHFQVQDKTSGLIIHLKRTEYELPEFVVFPTENPAHRIIENAIANREYNDPENLPEFSYTSYDKMIFTFELDSLPMIDTLEVDTASESFRDFLENHHIFIMESVSERKFMAPNNNYEKVIATKVAGLKDPLFVFLLSQWQSTSFYKETFNLLNKNYINPISRGSTRKYFFLLQDTLFTSSGDSIFVISYRPRLNTNFDGLKGVISINSNHWAIQNVIAEPAIREGALSLRIEQMYEFVREKQWFPVQLNTEVILNNVRVTDTTLEMGTGQMDTASIAIPFGIGKSYIRNINLDPDLRRRDFGSIEVEVDPNAANRKGEFWEDYRVDSLSIKEKNTYQFVDSIGQAENFDGMVKTMESLMTGQIPWGNFDIDIHRFLSYNTFEGFGLGLGLHTNDRLSQVWKVGGYVRYGFKDKKFKYGGDLELNLYRRSDLKIRLEMMEDVTETSGIWFFDDKPDWKNTENFRAFLIRKMDRTTLYRAAIGVRTLKYLDVNISLAKIHKEVTDDYRYAVRDENLAITFDQFDFTELRLGLRYAYGERFIYNMRKRISLGTDHPVFWLQYTRGISGFLEGDFDYNRYDFKIEKSFYTKYLGKTSLKLVGGYIDTDLPYNNLYNGHGAYRPFTINAPNSFATMRMNEFLSNKYVSLYFQHDFGKLLYEGGWMKPEFAVATNIGFGWLDFKDSHYNLDYKTMEQGYYESGILVNNLLNLKIYSLGLGVFYRYGPYGFKYGWDNVAGKFTLKFGF
ncbi:MAG: carboxypeptidase-like regulatory domain-containing protein [Bacteroidales bacterium]|nr:carboxypeptidase-like regulatory domain-containing protein [Bacteroidales bacterium]